MSQKDDLISRQAAIDEIEYELEMINLALDSITLDFNARERLRQRKSEAREILNSIQQLPSAQPEKRTEERTKTHACDLIDRQAAIMHFVKVSKNYECGMFDLKEVTHELWQLPSAQPDISEYSDKLWRNAYEREKRDAQPEIIRCKNCKDYQEGVDINGKPFSRCNGSVRTYGHTMPDWYCAWAERREE